MTITSSTTTLPGIADPLDYGLPKTDHSFAANPETDLFAGDFEALAIDVAAMTQTAVRAAAHVVSGATPSITAHRAVWGNTLAVAPSITRNGTGDYTLTWAAAYDDLNPTIARRVSHAVNIEFASACVVGAVAFVQCTWTANTVTVKTYDTSGTAADRDFVVQVF